MNRSRWVFFVAACWALTLGGQAQAQAPTVCPGETIALDISVASKPFVHMRLGDREGNFLIDTGATRTEVDAALYRAEPGTRIEIEGSSLPTLTGGTFWAVDLSSQKPFAPRGGFAGAIGTDVLSTRIVEFHYEAAHPYLALSTRSCSARTLEDAGFVAIPQQGYGASEAWRSWLASRSGTGAEIARRSNLPIIHARIGTVVAPFWLDSGFGGGAMQQLPIQINGTILTRLRDARVAMKRAGSVVSSDCEGHRATEPLWRVDGKPIVFTTEEGAPLFEYTAPTLQLRGRTACGTIGNWPEPIGAVGTLFLPRWGTVVFDGPNKRVWVPKATPALRAARRSGRGASLTACGENSVCED